MTAGRLRIARPLVEAMLQAARAAVPEECCGLLVGRGDLVTRLVPAANVHEAPRRFFTIDPAVQFGILRELRGSEVGEEVIGHYHSHPVGPAEPSPRDLAEAEDSEAVWVVIDPVQGEVGAFRPHVGQSFERILIESS